MRYNVRFQYFSCAAIIILAALASRWGFEIGFCVFLYIFVFLPLPVSNFCRALLTLFSFLYLSWCLWMFNSIGGVDEYHFYSVVSSKDYKEIIDSEFLRIGGSIGFLSSRNTFPAFVELFFSGWGGDAKIDHRFIVLFNMSFWLLSVSVWSKAIEIFISNRANAIAVAFLLASPTFLYWSSNYGKDVFVVSLTLLASALFLQKRYIGAFLLVVLASAFRPYAVAIFVSYLIPFVLSLKSTFFILFGALFVQLYLSSTIIAFLNSVLTFFFLILSPNPFNLNNWSVHATQNGWEYPSIVFSLESVLVLAVFLIAFYFLLSNRSRYIFSILLAVFLLAVTLSTVGVGNLQSKGVDVAIGSFGDNFVRKKIIIWPLISLLVGYILDGLRVKPSSGPDGSLANRYLLKNHYEPKCLK